MRSKLDAYIILYIYKFKNILIYCEGGIVFLDIIIEASIYSRVAIIRKTSQLEFFLFS